MAGAVAEMSGLIANPGSIWLAVERVDMRRGIDGLSMLVQQSLEPVSYTHLGLSAPLLDRAYSKIINN